MWVYKQCHHFETLMDLVNIWDNTFNCNILEIGLNISHYNINSLPHLIYLGSKSRSFSQIIEKFVYALEVSTRSSWKLSRLYYLCQLLLIYSPVSGVQLSWSSCLSASTVLLFCSRSLQTCYWSSIGATPVLTVLWFL